MSNTNLDDERLRVLLNAFQQNDVKLRKLSIANCGALTDQGLKAIGKENEREKASGTLSSTLIDFCMSGCYRVTDLGLMLISFPHLERLNYCGSYKVTDATRRYILAQNPTLLIYNKSKDFGLSSTATGGSSGLAGTFYDVTFDGFDEDIRGGNTKDAWFVQ